MKQKMVKSFGEFKDELEMNSDLQNQFKEDPISAINQFDQLKHPISSDKWIYRIIVLGLSITIISIIIGVLILIGSNKINGDEGVPTILTAIGSAAIGAVAGLLAPAPKGNENG